MVTPSVADLAARARRELLENILPFWRERTVDLQRGGFIGEMSNTLQTRPEAAKGLILNARILWTFSAAAPFTNDPADRALADRSYHYLIEHFLDKDHGGYYWELDPTGIVIDATKKIYGQAFCIYALSEYHRAFGEPAALQHAIDVFKLIESRAFDHEHSGYWEALSRDWQPIEDVRLSGKDMNERKSMNTHLHVLEAYTGLFQSWSNPELEQLLANLLADFFTHIVDPETNHLHHFFDEEWRPRSDSYTFGHDIEGSWLLCEAAETVTNAATIDTVRQAAVRIARTVIDEGVDADGGLFYEGRQGRIIDSNKEWWPQAEAVVGFLNAYEISKDEAFLEAAVGCWNFIDRHIIDRVDGEWFWRVDRYGTPDPNEPKVSMWKCPYHNGRACLEIIRRAESLSPTQPTEEHDD
jgi:cellobiose epimerase